MADLYDYLNWRGDLGFEEAPLCEVDNLILCLLSYVDLDGIVPPPGKGSITLREAAKEYFFTHEGQDPFPLGLIVPSEILTLFRCMAGTRRFASLALSGYANEISEQREMQFAALTVCLSQEAWFVAFRGTDDTLVGWREDFNLAFLDEVPSQRKAADYLDSLDLPPDTALWVGGHSKGGNLAVWGAVHASERVRRCIRRVWSNDGPGFSEGTVASEGYRILRERISIILPTDSLVGLLLEHDEVYEVINSHRRGISQHDGMSWEVMGASFVRADGLSRRGQRSDTVLRDHIASMTREEKETFVRLFFSALEATGARTLTELRDGGLRRTVALLRAVAEWDREDQETAVYLLGKLFAYGKAIPAMRPSAARRRRRRQGITIEFSPLVSSSAPRRQRRLCILPGYLLDS